MLKIINLRSRFRTRCELQELCDLQKTCVFRSLLVDKNLSWQHRELFVTASREVARLRGRPQSFPSNVNYRPFYRFSGSVRYVFRVCARIPVQFEFQPVPEPDEIGPGAEAAPRTPQTDIPLLLCCSKPSPWLGWLA